MQQRIEVPVGREVRVARWPSEIPLRVVVMIVSVLLWILIVVGTFGLGLVYVVLIALFLFFVQVGFVAYLRGSAIQLGPDQFPDLYRRVAQLSGRAGLKHVPETYILQADGALNAFATKLFRGQMVVLYADLLAACGDDEAARDMIIGHEIGHLRSGHLNWFLLTAPGRLIPFLGSAYSRACEYTCDRWGAALCGSAEGARHGLTVLAAGGVHARQVNVNAYMRQQQNLDTGWMTIARWLSTYPPLSARVAAIAPDPAAAKYTSSRGPLRAWGIILAIVLVPVAAVASIPLVKPLVERSFGVIASDLEGLVAPDTGSGEVTTYASAADMPPPVDVPEISDSDNAALASQCHAGTMQACDDLYYATPAGSAEEEYGNTCAGRFPGNNLECIDYLNQ
ncbi:M48 family metalloprotease [Mesorhizobium sp. CAU 1732]|uniref:M48 family metalloprotease n=1 Tax=Mesorhizobium sp. CAU 1732 TaxID=3140358 RepID=UPI0032607DFF